MNIKQIENIVAISEEGNVSRAAEKLFISQSALSQSLLNLEAELGVPLFERIKKKMKLTYAGENYISAAKEIIDIKKRTYKLLNDITDNKKGRFSTGVTSSRGLKWFTSIFPDFNQLYPEVIIDIKEAGARRLEQMVYKGEIDIATVSTINYEKELEYELIDSEEVYLILHKNHPLVHKFKVEQGSKINLLQLVDFENDNFIATNKDTSMRSIFDEICEQANLKPNIIFESSALSSIFQMVSSGIGVGVVSCRIPLQNDNIVFISFDEQIDRQLWATYRKNNYLTAPERYYISLIKAYFSNL